MPRKPSTVTPKVETPGWVARLSTVVSQAIFAKLPTDALIAGADALKTAVDGEQRAWLKTANVLHSWKEKFLAADLSISDHFEPWAEAVTGKGAGSIRTYLAARRVALDLGISTMSKEVLQAVSMYDLETARAILDESGGDIAKTREIKQRIAAEKTAADPEAAAKESVNRANRIKRFAKAFTDEVRSAIGRYLVANEPVDTAVLAEVYLLGWADGAKRMAPKTGLLRAEEMVAGATMVVETIQAEVAQAAEAGLELPVA